jgi:hypothetical protein
VQSIVVESMAEAATYELQQLMKQTRNRSRYRSINTSNQQHNNAIGPEGQALIDAIFGAFDQIVARDRTALLPVIGCLTSLPLTTQHKVFDWSSKPPPPPPPPPLFLCHCCCC